MMQIRARDDRALERLKRIHNESAEIIETTTADYRWRILVTPERAVEIIAREVQSIDYSNFKNACEFPQDTGPLHDVWSIMQGVQYERMDQLGEEIDPCF